MTNEQQQQSNSFPDFMATGAENQPAVQPPPLSPEQLQPPPQEQKAEPRKDPLSEIEDVWGADLADPMRRAFEQHSAAQQPTEEQRDFTTAVTLNLLSDRAREAYPEMNEKRFRNVLGEAMILTRTDQFKGKDDLELFDAAARRVMKPKSSEDVWLELFGRGIDKPGEQVQAAMREQDSQAQKREEIADQTFGVEEKSRDDLEDEFLDASFDGDEKEKTRIKRLLNPPREPMY